jgi:polyketide biosynthesis 3-hydroxy-3-methylglutaryl-CoA synthase-like enzyme PksG
MDTCRPIPDSEAGDTDLSLLSYLDCCENAYLEYQKRVSGVDYRHTFQYLSFHTPFGGMVRGAHRSMMRKIARAAPGEIEEDFQRRVVPGLSYCQRVGNIMGGTVLLSLVSTIENGRFDTPKRIGLFSYGSGCCSEFYSGVVSAQGQDLLRRYRIEEQLNARYRLKMDQYHTLLMGSGAVKFGTRNGKLDFDLIPETFAHSRGKGLLFLESIQEFHRVYRFVS